MKQDFLPRHATETVLQRLGVFRVVVVTGARQVGKSTLARLVVEQLGGSYLTLDDPLTLSEAAGDADGLVASTTGLTVIDEVQRVPDVLRAVKLSVDRDPTPGRFLLTGSANLLGMRAVTESLAGRAVYLDLLPLSWSESVGRTRPHTIDQAFSARSADEFAASLPAVGPGAGEEARRRALCGGMPEAFRLDVDSRRAWYDSYRRTFLERDLRQLSDISSVPEFGRVLSLALLRSGGLLNKSDVAADAQVSHSTVDRYLNLLQVAYQIRLLQPFFPNVAQSSFQNDASPPGCDGHAGGEDAESARSSATGATEDDASRRPVRPRRPRLRAETSSKRVVKAPKLYAVDSGAAAWAANAFDWRAAVASAKDGALMETFALSDVMAWDGLSGASRYHFWRTGAGAEVDLLIERGEEVVAIEVKSAVTLTRHDASGLRALRADLGDRFRLGIIAYLGQDVRVIDQTIVAVPLASLLGAA